MKEKRLFVGRKEELRKFAEFVKDHRGQAAIVAGPPGMGKTWLVNEMAEHVKSIPAISCGYVRCEVTETDSVDSVLALMIDHAFEAADTTEGYFDPTDFRKKQWKALLNVLKIGDLAASLRRDPLKNTREQFIKRMKLISDKMENNQRAIFIIDPEKYMQPGSDEAWAIVVRDLPEKIKLVFAQRPEDVLIKSETFDTLENVVRIPKKWLDKLDSDAVDKLIDLRADDVDMPKNELREALSGYKGHPYAISLLFDLISRGMRIKNLPYDLTYGTTKVSVEEQEKSIFEYDKITIKTYNEIVEDAINKIRIALKELDKSKRNIVIMLFSVLFLGVIGVLGAIISKRWDFLAMTSTSVILFVLWPVRQIIRLYNEEKLFRLIPPLLPLCKEEEGKKAIKELINKMIIRMK